MRFLKKEKLFEDITPRGGGVCVRVESFGGEKSIFFSPLSARVEPGNIDLVFSCVLYVVVTSVLYHRAKNSVNNILKTNTSTHFRSKSTIDFLYINFCSFPTE